MSNNTTLTARQKYIEQHKDEAKALRAKWKADGRDALWRSNWRAKHKERMKTDDVYRQNYIAKQNEYVKRPDVVAKRSAGAKVYHEKKGRELCRKRYQKRLQTDEIFKMKEELRRNIWGAFKRIGSDKPINTITLLGCTWQEAKDHFEKLFQPGMTWSNHGEWHIDHIIPIASVTTIDEVVKLNHITNLQPLWAADNLSKGSRIES